MSDHDVAAWAEYDAAADWCAARGWCGGAGTPVPLTMSASARALVFEDPEAFLRRVRDHAFARAMGETAGAS
jgi:hypothetical protein